MPDYVIADTSVLIIFDKIDQLDLLQQVYHTLHTTPEIATEFNKKMPAWIIVESVTDQKYKTFLETCVDPGEASAIALAVGKVDSLLILDDLKARKLAKSLNLQYTRSLGVIQKAKSKGLIPNLKPLLNKLKTTDFRISENIISELLRRNKEA